jgi:5'-deoxynucleotidase YfbR-like HD superfamily hydrolase
MKHTDVIRSVAMACRVKRYHTFPTIHEQTVAEHSHRVAMIYLQLFGTPRVEVLEYILKHDLGELGAGDTPFYSKRRVPELKDATNKAEKLGLADLGITLPDLFPEEWQNFKVCDLLEMLENGSIEEHMGNRYGRVVVENVMLALKGMVSDEEIGRCLQKLWPREIT